MGTATVTIKEAHASVFTDGFGRDIAGFVGVPDNAMLHRNAMFDFDDTAGR